jgi:hypothetical protein
MMARPYLTAFERAWIPTWLLIAAYHMIGWLG